MNRGNWVFSVILSTVSALACYNLRHLSTNFDIFFVDIKAVVLSTVYKYYFLLGHFCVTPVRQQDQCYQPSGLPRNSQTSLVLGHALKPAFEIFSYNPTAKNSVT